MIELPDHMPDHLRLKLLYTAIATMFLLIVVRLWFLQIVKGPELAAQAEEIRSRLIRRIAPRGEIVDVKGRKLATNRSHFVVSILPDDIKKNPQVVPRLAALLGITEGDIQDMLQANKPTPYDPVPVMEDVGVDVLSKIEEQHLDLPGVLITKDPYRQYVDNMLCTHALGVVRPISAEKLDELRSKGYRGGDMIGTEGLESFYEADLRGKDGGQRVEVDARGRIRRNIEEITPVPGHTLRLTIDRDVQQAAYDGLREQLGKGHAGSAVAIDPRDGAVLAFVSSPSYDQNRYGMDYNKFRKDPMLPLINRASRSMYPSGSPFKLITAAAGLEAGVITPTSTDYCSGYVQLGRQKFHCDKRSGHGSITFNYAIGASCDVFFYHVAQGVGPTKLAQMAERFGLGRKTGLDLPGEKAGLVPSPAWKKKRFKQRENQVWHPGETLIMGIGQGYDLMTPLQLCVYTTALANGGSLLRPQLVREIVDTSGPQPKSVRMLKRDERGSIGLRPEYRDAIVKGMQRAMQEGGTAATSAIEGLDIAGKTGTAEAFMKGKPVDHSLFVCFAPVGHPRIAIAVMVEGAGHGSMVAAPIARSMMLKYFNIGHNAPTVARNGGD